MRQAEQLGAERAAVLRRFVDDQVRPPPLGDREEVGDGLDRRTAGEHGLPPGDIALRSRSNRRDLGEPVRQVRRHPVEARGEMGMPGCLHVGTE